MYIYMYMYIYIYISDRNGAVTHSEIHHYAGDADMFSGIT